MLWNPRCRPDKHVRGHPRRGAQGRRDKRRRQATISVSSGSRDGNHAELGRKSLTQELGRRRDGRGAGPGGYIDEHDAREHVPPDWRPLPHKVHLKHRLELGRGVHEHRIRLNVVQPEHLVVHRGAVVQPEVGRAGALGDPLCHQRGNGLGTDADVI
jgi:hypothetical protein